MNGAALGTRAIAAPRTVAIRRVQTKQFSCSRVVLLLAGATLTGCTVTSVQRNLDATSQFSQREMGVPVGWRISRAAIAAAQERARQLLAEPLTAEGAVELALRYSPGFQALLADSAAASAASTQSIRIPNPLLGFGRLAAGGAVEIDRALSVSLLDFVLWPQRRRLGNLQQAQHRLRSAGDVVSTVLAARQAWIDAVSAGQSARYAEQVQTSANATAELAKRMTTAGNFARIEQARHQVFSVDAAHELARAQLEAAAARETLIRVLGLSGDLVVALKLPERLPDLPTAIDPETVIAKRALEDRLDIQLSRAELDYTARSLGLTRITSLVNAFELGATSNSVPAEGTLKGYSADARLPLFDVGDARRANAQALYEAAMSRTAQVIVDAHSHLRASYLTYRTTYDIARQYRDDLIPLRKSIAEENQLRYNGMLISVFELLADQREQVTTVRQAIASEREFWKADSVLRATLIGQPVESVVLGSPTLTPGAGTAAPH